MASDGPRLRTFLISDIRGYTAYTRSFGDAAAGELAERFASLAEPVMVEHEGRVLGLRGDEVLAGFDSARQALRAAVELQRRCRAELALGVGVGLDAGEAVPARDGYRGAALNTAGRLCSIAAPGEVLASETVVALAGRMDGLMFSERPSRKLKGLDRPVRPIAVEPEEALPPVPEPPAAPAQPFVQRAPRRLSHRWIAVLAVAGLAVVALVGVSLLRSDSTGSPEASTGVPENSVAVIDAVTGKVTGWARTQLSATAVSISYGEGAAWTYDADEQSMIRIDPETLEAKRFGVGQTPTDVLAGAGAVWLATPEAREVLRYDPNSSTPDHVELGGEGYSDPRYGAMSLAVDGETVWSVSGFNPGIVRIEEGGLRVARLHPDAAYFEIAVGGGVLWTSEKFGSTEITTSRLPSGNRVGSRLLNTDNSNAGSDDDLAANDAGAWYMWSDRNQVVRLSAAPLTVGVSVTIPDTPTGIALDDDGNLWVSSFSGDVYRIDAATNQITKTVHLGHWPTAIAYGDGRLWVTVQGT